MASIGNLHQSNATNYICFKFTELYLLVYLILQANCIVVVEGTVKIEIHIIIQHPFRNFLSRLFYGFDFQDSS